MTQTGAAQHESRSGGLPDTLTLAAIGALGLVCLVLAFLGNGNVALAVAPLALALAVVTLVKVPLRYSLYALGFLCLVLENPAEAPATGLWRSPLYVVGALMLNKLNNTLPIQALVFSGLDVVLALLVGTWAYRRMTGVRLDLAGHVPPAPPLRTAGLVCLSAIFLVWGFGMVRPGFSFGNSLWQVFRVIYLPAVFLLFCAGLRGSVDARPIGVVLLAAALLRACLAIYVRVLFPDKEVMPHATTHFDSMLFSDAILLVLVVFLERPTRRSLLILLGVVPIVSLGMVANNRRIAWVDLLVSLAVLYAVTPWTRVKRQVARAIVIALPVLALYAVIGWSAPSGVFAPVRTLRSVVDSKVDTSTLWRDWENYNLYYTLKGNPFLGTGYGHEYIEAIHLPDISGGYALYRYAPHNSILGLLCYSGYIGFAGMWMLLPLGIFFAVRSHRAASSPSDRIVALASLGALVAYLVQCYGDMALGSWTSVFTVAPALALIAKLAVSTGAWPLSGVQR